MDPFGSLCSGLKMFSEVTNDLGNELFDHHYLYDQVSRYLLVKNDFVGRR